MPRGDKFISLSNYFRDMKVEYIKLSFSEMERILGFELSRSAYIHKEYWYKDKTHTFPDTWINEGCRLTRIDLNEKTAEFCKDLLQRERVIQKGAHFRSCSINKNNNTYSHYPSINIDYALERASDYFNMIAEDENARYLSWEHCYEAFRKRRNSVLSADDIDLLCNQLAFYLASWGMYRGSSFLLQKDYKVHRDIVIELYKDKYSDLWAALPEDLLKKDNRDKLFSLRNKLEKIYVVKRKNIDGHSTVSDILLTKILMGTLGCVPAYDRYFAASIRKYDIASGTFNSTSILNLAEFYLTNKEKFEAWRKRASEKGLEYPPMKVIDMCFWQIGVDEVAGDNDNDQL